MAFAWSRRPLIAIVVAAGWLAASCSSAPNQQETGAIGSSGANAAAIAIERTSSYLTIENRAGLPLVDVTISLKATNGLTFGMSIPRLESGSKRDVPFGNLRGSDGTTFNPQWHRAAQVSVAAKDIVGKKYDVTTPLK
jgi:hypothetical protein